LVYYCTCQRVSKEKLQVASHKPIIWPIRGLGLPRTYWGWASAETPPWTTPTGWCCKTYPEAHSEAHTEYATEFAGQTLETVNIVTGCSEALAHDECQKRNLEIKTDNERTIPFVKNSKPAFQNCSDNEKAHDFVATLTGSAPLPTVEVPSKVGANTTSSYFEL
jgi:hypothetical protein